jgi:hypothetical protein
VDPFYRLTPNTSLNWRKDERNVSGFRRFKVYPFPLLNFIESFEPSVGDWHTSLGDFGIKTRARYKETSYLAGTKFNLLNVETISSRGNTTK